jgi:hypothetical protein
MRKFIVFAAVLTFGSGMASAQQAALVEEVKGRDLGVEFMDYVDVGRVIELGSAGEMILGYLSSCIRETIQGGTVTIGVEKSEIVDGTVNREKVECDGGQMRLSQSQSRQAAAMVLRDLPRSVGAPSQAQTTLYGQSPMLDVQGGGIVMIERVDQPGEYLTIRLVIQQPQQSAFYDLAKSGHTLVAGGTYRASVGPRREIVFKVDTEAKPGHIPIVSRLLRL